MTIYAYVTVTFCFGDGFYTKKVYKDLTKLWSWTSPTTCRYISLSNKPFQSHCVEKTRSATLRSTEQRDGARLKLSITFINVNEVGRWHVEIAGCVEFVEDVRSGTGTAADTCRTTARRRLDSNHVLFVAVTDDVLFQWMRSVIGCCDIQHFVRSTLRICHQHWHVYYDWLLNGSWIELIITSVDRYIAYWVTEDNLAYT